MEKTAARIEKDMDPIRAASQLDTDEVIKLSELRNWLELLADPLPHQVIVRQTFLNREKEQAATLRLERVGQPTMPAPASPERLIAGLETTGLFVAGASMMFARWAAEVSAIGNRVRT